MYTVHFRMVYVGTDTSWHYPGPAWLAIVGMAKFVALLILALLAISMLHTVMGAHGRGGHHYNDKNAHHNALGDAREHNTTSPACSSVRNAVANACACLLAIMATKLCALATTTGRPRKEDQSALDHPYYCIPYLLQHPSI
ncbi:hypothetical protein G2W53_025164 [Senna tora]|uniref:Uncharacterized protein n=1 Tax=Senna tora TaxID=362788 RepID=A0A834WK10_9FABA|nr:hypothetical protein G2W53_025164 [Senna tora]